MAGAEYSHRGFLEGYDPETGKHLWRSYNIPGKGEKGAETWKGDTDLVGGGTSWVTGTYDPELDLVYWGIGNPVAVEPAHARGRQPLHQFHLRGAAEDRRARLVVPDHASRSVRL